MVGRISKLVRDESGRELWKSKLPLSWSLYSHPTRVGSGMARWTRLYLWVLIACASDWVVMFLMSRISMFKMRNWTFQQLPLLLHSSGSGFQFTTKHQPTLRFLNASPPSN